MTLRLLSIEKFKCFKTLNLPLAPLTLLTGYNAAGKSTAAQSLLLMAQGLRRSPQATALALNGPLVKLGGFADVVAHNTDGRIIFRFESDEEKAEWCWEPSRNHSGRFLSLLDTKVIDKAGKCHRSKAAMWPNGARRCALVQTVRDTIYLGASRQSGLEAYPAPYEASVVHADVGAEGEYAPWWYVQSADDAVGERRRHPTEERLTVRGQVDAWLKELFGNASANAESISRTALTRLDLRMSRTSDWCRPINTGYGLSYAFPLLVALTTANEGQILIVDSPEAHLHPRAQSMMGRMLGHFAAAGVQIIIESHSDHILSGLRLAVRDGRLRPNDLQLHFFGGANDLDDGVGITSPRVDSAGEIDFWPPGFFDQTEQDLSALTGWA